MFRSALLIAGKDLRIERRSRVGLSQIVPFALTMLVLFGLALDPDSGLLRRAAPGLFWLAVLLSGVFAVQRSFAVESRDGARDGLRMLGLDPVAIYIGKTLALAAQLLAVELVLAFGSFVLFGFSLQGTGILLLTCLCATVGIATTGTIYGALVAGARGRETLLPLLFLPIVAPVLLAATRASEAALDGFPVDAWPWIRLLAIFAVVYSAVGSIAFGPLLEDS